MVHLDCSRVWSAGLVDAHDLTIQWGDGSSSTLTLAAGQVAFSAPHPYLDNPVGGSTFTINVAVADAAPDTGTASTTRARCPPTWN